MDLAKRKPTRLRGFDYSTPGAYFVTICTHGRKRLLSHIIVGEGFHPLPQNKLTTIGEEVDASVQYINNNYAGVTINKYVIMPNHIHMIVFLNNPGGGGTPPLQSVVGQLKSYTSKKYKGILWQRSFHDHIIRNETVYQKIWEYIDTNVARWKDDCFYNEG